MKPCLPSLDGAAVREHSIGVSVSETIAEMTTAMVRVRANSRNMRPTRPLMKSSGMNTAIRDRVSDIDREADLARALERRF